MKNIFLIGLIVGAATLSGCDLIGEVDEPEDTPCSITNETVPILVENTSFAEKEYGYTSLGIEKGDYDAFIVSTSSTSPYYPNFESTTTRYTPLDDINGEIFADGEFDGKDYWFIHANFEATNAEITYSVYLECDKIESEDKVISQTTDLTIFSPDLCELMDIYSIWETIYDGIPASQSAVNVRLAMNGYNGDEPLNMFISEDGIVIKSTVEFGGVTEPSKEFSFPDMTNISTELALDLFELTGYDQSTWPQSHNANGGTVNIKLELKLCDTWHPLGLIIWQTLG